MNVSLNRRGFLGATAAATALGFNPALAADVETLDASVVDLQLLPERYDQTRVWAFNGAAPGPEIRVMQGDRVRRRLTNALPQATSVHWHGIRIDNAMDGIAGLTQEPVPPGASFDYDFVAPDAGTYWYHSHNRSFEQVARGLHGALIVQEPTPVDVDHDEVLVIDDWLVDPNTGQFPDTFGAPHDLSHAGRYGNYVSANGKPNYAKSVKRHERLRLRLINAANARVFELALIGLDGWVVALDGMPLAEPLRPSEIMVLAPAQRMDLIVDVTAEDGDRGRLEMRGRDGTFILAAYDVQGEGARSRRVAPTALPPNRHEQPSLTDARRIELLMEGGAMGGMRGAMMNGRMSTMRDMMRASNFWAFNGSVGTMDGPPLATLARGETAHLMIINDTAFPHAMHLHGMHFHVINADGSLGPLRDTTLLNAAEQQEIAFVADNPGRWLLHCHMLSHAASGMMARIDVT